MSPLGPLLTFSSELWMYPGEAAWYFITLPLDCAEAISALQPPKSKGFGSVRVRATVGNSTWDTSVFPDKKRGSYLLPVKKEVRTKHKLKVGNKVSISLEIVDL